MHVKVWGKIKTLHFVIVSRCIVQVYCHMGQNHGWTLVARFSNNDEGNWMEDDAGFWYDKLSPVGQTTNPAENADMISPAFGLVKGNDIKITRNDSPTHQLILSTKTNCLGGRSFREKIASYGEFRQSTVWATDKCLGSCVVSFNSNIGDYTTISGFEQAKCDGELQSRKNIGFWCDWSAGDGAVMMIGGGGSSCSRADHGIGITEANAANFAEYGEKDFGTDSTGSTSYALNLWVR